jgi:hypothetical protein
MHSLDERHETLVSSLVVPAAGVDWMLQLVPFHDCAIVCSPASAVYDPTAVHAVALVHETSLRADVLVPAGAGTMVGVIVLPFQRDTNAFGDPPLT